MRKRILIFLFSFFALCGFGQHSYNYSFGYGKDVFMNYNQSHVISVKVLKVLNRSLNFGLRFYYLNNELDKMGSVVSGYPVFGVFREYTTPIIDQSAIQELNSGTFQLNTRETLNELYMFSSLVAYRMYIHKLRVVTSASIGISFNNERSINDYQYMYIDSINSGWHLVTAYKRGVSVNSQFSVEIQYPVYKNLFMGVEFLGTIDYFMGGFPMTLSLNLGIEL
jgi:hypothetical protein